LSKDVITHLKAIHELYVNFLTCFVFQFVEDSQASLRKVKSGGRWRKMGWKACVEGMHL